MDELLPVVYERLRAVAAEWVGARLGRTVDPTELVHEAYLKLIDQSRASFEGRRQFFAVAARAMRRLLVDRARREAAARRGGDLARTTLRTSLLGEEQNRVDLLDLDEALCALERDEPRAAALVELRFFAGLSIADAATQLGVSTATVERDWRYARAWLYRRLAGQ